MGGCGEGGGGDCISCFPFRWWWETMDTHGEIPKLIPFPARGQAQKVMGRSGQFIIVILKLLKWV